PRKRSKSWQAVRNQVEEASNCLAEARLLRGNSVNTQQHPKVALLLATYNGARFVEPQIRSLKENSVPFTLHWIDDHSTDDTRDAVRASALDSRIDFVEWHQPQHKGYPGAFFQLLECVDADIYLFCDQDDIWQPGKIDATVANL